MKVDEKRQTKPFKKVLKCVRLVEKEDRYEIAFVDFNGNIFTHYQLKPEEIDDVKSAKRARTYLSFLLGKNNGVGHFYSVVCKCREMTNYGDNAIYANADIITAKIDWFSDSTKGWQYNI